MEQWSDLSWSLKSSRALILYQSIKFYTGSKLKAFADHILTLAEMIIIVYDHIENNVWKGENAGYHAVFKKPLP